MAKKKKRKGSGFFSNLLLILCILIFCVAAWKLWGYYRHYHGGKKEYEQLRQYVKGNADPDEQKTKKEKDKCPITVDFEALAKVNPDVKAWIYIKGTGINLLGHPGLLELRASDEHGLPLRHGSHARSPLSGRVRPQAARDRKSVV